MLQTYKSLPVREPESGPMQDMPFSTEGRLGELFLAIVGFIRRQLPIGLIVMPLTVGLAVVYLLTTPPLYQGVTRIIIDTGKLQIFQRSILADNPVNLAMIDSQLEILKSENFVLSVIKKLNLTKDPEFVGAASGIVGNAMSRLGLSEWDEPRSESEILRRAVKVFEDRLTVGRVGVSYVIEIGFRSTSKDRAALIANAVADTFIADQLETKYQTIRTATGWLQDRLNELRGQALAAERAVVEYKTSHNIVDTGGHLINEQQVSEINSALIKARADAVETKARLDRVQQIISADNLDPSAAELATVADTLHNEVIIKLRQQYLDLSQRAVLLSNRLGPSHLAVVNLHNQMREIRRSIIDELRQIAQAYTSDYAIAKARENSLETSLASTVAGSQSTNKAQGELRQLESAAQSYRMLYDNFQQRYTDSVQQESFPMSEARIITRATPPLTRASPKPLLILAAGIIGGLIMSIGIGILREVADRVFRTSDQVETELNTECLALVPMMKSNGTAPLVETEAAIAYNEDQKVVPLNTSLTKQIVDAPLSRFAESVRAIKVAADLSRLAKPNKVIGITSSLPNEGKSTIAACLAQLSAHTGASTILVDCDLRQPSLSRELVQNATVGIIDVITGMASLEDAVWTDPSTKLAFLPAVTKLRVTHTSEILASDALKQLFDRLRKSYDYIITDLSPLAPIVDVRMTGHLVDSYVFVVEWGKTKIDVVEHALDGARGVQENLLGVVLNKVELNKLVRYEGHRGDYYYHSDYARYGYAD